MSGVRSFFGTDRVRLLLLAVVAVGLLSAAGTPLGPHGRATTSPAAVPSFAVRSTAAAGSIEEVGSAPSSAVVGRSVGLAWQALAPNGTRATSFAVDCNLTVEASTNGSAVPAWVNSSTAGPLDRSASGTFPVPAYAWSGGVLELSVSVGSALPVTVRLFGSLLPTLPAAVPFSVSPDLDHLVLYDPVPSSAGPGSAGRANDTFWHVRDPFGDPTPGAFLVVAYSTPASSSTTFVPVSWTTGGATGAWVNLSASGPTNGTFRVSDEAGTTLIGPVAVPAPASVPPPPSPSLPPAVVVALALLGVGGLLGIALLALGARRRPSPRASEGEEELRRLAEGRGTVVELLRRAGPLGLAGIEAAWEPPPAPPAVADWVASLVTDGTLTATLGEDGRARFSLAERPAPGPKVTLDEEALAREIARREAATGAEDEERR